MLSLAPWFYRGVMAADGGPICSVTCAALDVIGRRSYQANAFLSPDLVPAKQLNGLYGNSDGTGTHDSPQVARHMAISEALERWAYWSVSKTPQGANYAFDRDDSTTGLAAFPGLFKRQARSYAYLEALERWALASWWIGELPAQLLSDSFLGASIVRVVQTEGHGEVVILFRRAASGHVSYGYAAGKNLKNAVVRAATELLRNDFVLSFAKMRGTQPANSYERRCVYFASDEGHREFMRRVEVQQSTPRARFNLLFDGEVSGPWSKYATVWRVVPQLPSAYLAGGTRFFAW